MSNDSTVASLFVVAFSTDMYFSVHIFIQKEWSIDVLGLKQDTFAEIRSSSEVNNHSLRTLVAAVYNKLVQIIISVSTTFLPQ